LIIIGVN
jgi:hypothetical protein